MHIGRPRLFLLQARINRSSVVAKHPANGASARYASICRARASFCTKASSSRPFKSSDALSTKIGFPITRAIVLNGFGTIV